MFTDNYFARTGANIVISEQQGSDFAKHIAGDFNPIHDEGSKRFCVPGDLLFALAVSNYGLRQHMHFAFTGMVSGGQPLHFPEQVTESGVVTSEQGKPLLQMTFDGNGRNDGDFSEAVIRAYVAFSGQNFPYILVPLLADSGVMINPDRPLVIYESMALSFKTLDFNQPTLRLSRSTLDINGKRGDVHLDFDIEGNGYKVGEGKKKLVISGLQPYDEERMTGVIEVFLARKALWHSEPDHP